MGRFYPSIMNMNIMHRFQLPVALILLLHNTLIIDSECSHVGCESNHMRYSSSSRQRHVRNEADLITTTACSSIRNRKDYNARVDVTYLYLFEYTLGNGDTDMSDDTVMLLLHSIERAVATSVATTLVQCTTNGQYPLYALDIAPMLVDGTNATTILKHIVVPSSYDRNYTSNDSQNDIDADTCPLSRNSVANSTVSATTLKCIKVLGMTSILFSDGDGEKYTNDNNGTASDDHGNISTPSDMDWTFIDTLIAATIEDEYYLNQFVLSNVVLSDRNIQLIQTQFDRSIGNNIILTPFYDDDPTSIDTSGSGDTKNGTVKVAIISAVLSFTFTILALSLILCYCRCCKPNDGSSPRHHPSGSKNQGMIQKRFRRQRPDLYTFEPLDDEFHYSDSNDPTIVPSGWIVDTSNGDPNGTMGTNHPLNNPKQEDELPSTGRYVATAWSDLTSDSESIMSSLHLDRIDEVDEELGDYSYEQQPYDVDVGDLDVSNTQNLHRSEENCIEVRLKNRAVARPPHIHPDCKSLDFVEDWKVSYQSIDVALINDKENTNDQYDTQARADLSIEISIDDEVIVAANDTVEQNQEDPFAFPHGMVEDSFTFPSDDDSDGSHREHQTHTSAEELPSGHIYDADDFQSIEISVVWMDSEALDRENDKEEEDEELEIIFSEEGTHSSSAILAITMSQPTTEVTEDDNETSVEDMRNSKAQPTAFAVSSQPVISALTDSEKFVLQDSTESTLFTNDDDPPDSFSSSNAYRSVLDKLSYPTIVDESHTHSGSSGSATNGDTDDDGIEIPTDRHSNTAIAHWARDVLMKLMSDSPKMLRCDQSDHEHDFDSYEYQSSDDT